MAENTQPEDAVDERGPNRPAFSWPGRRRAEEAAEAADRVALQGLERLRAKPEPAQADEASAAAPEIEEAGDLRDLVLEATEQLRNAIRIEATEIGRLLRAERESVEQAIHSLQELIAETRNGVPPGSGSAEGTEQLPPPEEGVIDLNEASHADLRAIGMSETQASRVIRHRDFYGDFHSVDELDHVPGFAPEIRAELEQRLTLGTDEELTDGQ